MRNRQSIQQLSILVGQAPPPRDFIGALRGAAQRTGKPGLIAEVKKASPSRGVLQPDFDAVRVRRRPLPGQAPPLRARPLRRRSGRRSRARDESACRLCARTLPLAARQDAVPARPAAMGCAHIRGVTRENPVL